MFLDSVNSLTKDLPQCRSVEGVQVLEYPLVRCKLSIAAKDSERFPLHFEDALGQRCKQDSGEGEAMG